MVGKEIKSIIDRIFGDPDRVSHEFLYFCPRCRHRKKKLSINYDKNKFKCWVCEPLFSGDISFLIKKYGDKEDLNKFIQYSNIVSSEILERIIFPKSNSIKKDVQVDLPQEYEFILKSKTAFAQKSIEHLLGTRGLSISDLFANKIGVCCAGDYRNRIIFPSFNENGYCNFFAALDLSATPKYKWLYSKVPKSHIIFNELNIDWDKPVYITEGNIDAYKIGNNSIPLLGKRISIDDSGYSKLLESLWLHEPIIYLCLDTDLEKGEYINRSIKAAEILIKYGIKNIFIANPYPYKDFGEIPQSEVSNFIQNSTKIESNLDLMQYSLELEMKINA